MVLVLKPTGFVTSWPVTAQRVVCPMSKTCTKCEKTATRRLASEAPLCGAHYYEDRKWKHGSCVVEGCGRPCKVVEHGLCAAHYHRLRRNGAPEAMRRRESRQICRITGCDKLDTGPQGLCSMHDTRVRRYGDPNFLPERSYKRGPDHPNWVGDEVTYFGLHHRLKVERGSASGYSCVSCGNQAVDWAYDHTCLEERQSEHGPYSTDLNRYQQMCKPCHVSFDRKRVAA
jgi:hypothetical protein